MEVLSNVESVPTDDFLYDLFYGGYFRPDKFLKNEDDIKRVKNAIKVIKDYQNTLEDNDLLEEI